MVIPDLIVSTFVYAGPYVAIFAAAALGFYLRRKSAWQSMRSLEAMTQRAESVEERLRAAEVALAEMRSQVADLEEQARLSSGAPAKSWTNINRRTQAVRMLRAGDAASHVAAELSMSRAEVELIRKVHSLTASTCEGYSGLGRSPEPSIFPNGG